MLRTDGRHSAADAVERSRAAVRAPCYNGEAAIGKVAGVFRAPPDAAFVPRRGR